MIYHTYTPSPPLSDFVHSFWASSYTESHPRVRILPRGTVELVINLTDDEICLYTSTHSEQSQRLPGIVISGAYAGAVDIDPMRHASMMGVHFKPGGAFALFGAAVGEIANIHLALEALWGRLAGELRERLCSASTARQRFWILEDTLTARLQGTIDHPAVPLALGLFGSEGTGNSVRAVAQRVGLSQRRFIQLFTAHVGLTPKLFCRILRFQHVREFVNQTSTLNWAQLALAGGYYDQSHLIRDFRKFSGLSPTDYLSRLGDIPQRSHALPIG